MKSVLQVSKMRGDKATEKKKLGCECRNQRRSTSSCGKKSLSVRGWNGGGNIRPIKISGRHAAGSRVRVFGIANLISNSKDTFLL